MRVTAADCETPAAVTQVIVTVSPTLCAWIAALSWVALLIAMPLTAVMVSPVVMFQ